MNDVTRILSAIEQGDPSAAEQLLPLVYEELRKLAAHKMAQERPGQTLQATALVHEAYLRLVNVGKVQHWDSRGHLFSAVFGSNYFGENHEMAFFRVGIGAGFASYIGEGVLIGLEAALAASATQWR
jgi:hypothetical protein